MLATLRAGLTAALLLVSSLSALSADKPYHRDDLAEAATRVEGQIKADAGTVAKPLAALRRDADAAVRAQGPGRRPGCARKDRSRRPGGRRELAAPRPHHPADAPGGR